MASYVFHTLISAHTIQTDLRPLHENSKLCLCSYQPKCTKRDNCTHAHSEEELEYWKVQLLKAVRPYRKGYRLYPCKSADDDNKYCQKALQCEYAHSQKELDHWVTEQEELKSKLYGKIRPFVPDHHQVKLCDYLKENRPCCIHGSECKFAHSQKELDVWSGQLECRKSEKRLLEMCRNAMKSCKFGGDCRYAHNDKELQTWKEGI
jgi:hypothetical protein